MNQIHITVNNISELREKVKLATLLFNRDVEVFVKADFTHVKTSETAFLSYNFVKVLNIGYKHITLIVDGEMGTYASLTPITVQMRLT